MRHSVCRLNVPERRVHVAQQRGRAAQVLKRACNMSAHLSAAVHTATIPWPLAPCLARVICTQKHVLFCSLMPSIHVSQCLHCSGTQVMADFPPWSPKHSNLL